MTNRYYVPSGEPVVLSRGSSAKIRGEFALVDTALGLVAGEIDAEVAARTVAEAGLAHDYSVAVAASGVATTKAGLTAADAIATAADRVQTGLDRIAATNAAASLSGGPVISVNGKTGVAVITAAEVGAQSALDASNLKTVNGNSLLGSGDVSVGYLNIPQNIQSAAYTAVLADQGKHILHPSADTTERIFTIPANAAVAYPIGTAITFVNQVSAGVVTIAITTDVMRLAGAGTTGSRTLAANGIATALKLTATEWLISGSGLV